MNASTVPEIVQRGSQDVLAWRCALLASVTDMGPPDLVVLAKADAGGALSTYFYQTGTNATSAAALVASLHDITGGLQSQLWFGKQRSFRATGASYVVYNPFSKVDLKVEVAMPGGASWVVIEGPEQYIKGSDLGPEKADALWLETFTAGVVRALATCDDEGEFAPIVEVRRLNPFSEEGTLQLFLEGVETLFERGPLLGCSDKTLEPSLVDNLLVDALLRCVEVTGCADTALALLTRLNEKLPLSSLLAKVMLAGQHEHQALELMSTKLLSTNSSPDPAILYVEGEYLLKKGKPQLALPLAIRGVNSAPTSFSAWALLAKTYIVQGMFKEALVTLNSCPMVTHREKYTLKRITVASQPNGPAPQDIHLPLPTVVDLEGVTNLDHSNILREQSQCPPDLLSLPAGNLKSTYKEAYALLAEIVRRLDWSQLLDLRAEVFVMEEELRSGSPAASSKRMCERWLDNLFMLLYEDLKMFNLFKQNQQYQDAAGASGAQAEAKPLMGVWGYASNIQGKSALEWETIGQVCQRLGHLKDAQKCYELALGQRFSVRAARSLLSMYTDARARAFARQRDFSKLDDAILGLTLGLLAWEGKWYKFFSPKLLDALQTLALDWGTSKLLNEAPNDAMATQLKSAVSFLVKCGRLEED